jgi:hypothetical protein
MADSVLPDDRLTLIVEGVRIEASAWEVPLSNDFSNGLKYRFQALDMDENHIQRWDNTNDTHGPRRHKHLPDGGIEPIDNPPETPDEVQELLKEFIDEVTER